LEQKPLKTSGKCHKKRQKSLGKDEVGSSNLPSSSKTLENFGFQGFSLCTDKTTDRIHNLQILQKGCGLGLLFLPLE